MAAQLELLPELASLHGAPYVLPDVELRRTGELLGPPGDEDVVVGDLVAAVPVDLRHDVVYPALVRPVEDVGREVIVGL